MTNLDNIIDARKYVKSVLRQNIAFFDQIGVGEITSRLSNDAELIRDGISEKVRSCSEDNNTGATHYLSDCVFHLGIFNCVCSTMEINSYCYLRSTDGSYHLRSWSEVCLAVLKRSWR